MHSSLLVLLALLGGAHAFASTPKEVAGTTGKGVPSRMTYSGTTSSVCEADSCKYAGDGDCDDGGEGSAWSVCELGSDGSDCADRGTKGCTVPQCAVGEEYHKANAQGGYDCGLVGDVWVEKETSVCGQMTIWDSKIKRCVPCVYNPTHWTHKRCDRCADWNPHRNTYYQCDR